MSALSFERQVRPIYDAIDTGSNKSAIAACNKVLKKYPKSDLVKALKALALVRSQKIEESLVLVDEVFGSKPTDEAILGVMSHVLRALGRHKDLVVMYDEAYKRSPNNEELGVQLFFANARTGNWKAAQQTATKLQKSFQESKYMFWGVMGAVLQANDPTTPPPMREILYKLAHRLLGTSQTPAFPSSERMYLHLMILRELGLYDDALEVLNTPMGQNFCAINLYCDEIRRDLWRLKGLVKEEGERAETRILEKKDRNWLEFVSVINGVFAGLSSEEVPSAEAQEECKTRLVKAQELFSKVQELDGRKDRSGSLALIHLEHKARKHGVSTDDSRLVQLMTDYFRQIGDKACCFEDLKPFNLLEGEEKTKWVDTLRSVETSEESVDDLRRSINVEKLYRHLVTKEEIDEESEVERAYRCIEKYFEGLKLGKDLPSTELQPADDLIILAVNALVGAWAVSSDVSHLHQAVALLEFALQKSKHAFQIRLILIRIYRLLGAPMLALEHYRAMNVKQVQHDTLSHFALSRAASFSLAATGDLTWLMECMESSQIYLTNSTETAEFVVKAFQLEKYTQIPEFVSFEDKLDNSFYRDVIKMEHVRMRFAHEILSMDMVDMELIELKFIFDRTHHDNRDFDTMPNYQPACSPSLNEQTVLFGKTEGHGWLSCFLKLYIRALQQASNMDDTVEEKILVGDRPKAQPGVNSAPLAERIKSSSEEEQQELTPDERRFILFGNAVADWLHPYHDHARPPAEVVLAEAAKAAALKTGQPAKGFDLPPSASGAGTPKKSEEPPAAVEPPESITAFFAEIKALVQEACDKKDYPIVLHRATIAQEALIYFAIETMRFKETSVVKINKFSWLVTALKNIRTTALESLQEIATSLTKLAEEENAERRKALAEDCSDLPIESDVVTEVAKKITESRKKTLEGIAKGITKLCNTHKPQ